jgi:S1/P1 nuclease
MRLFVVCVALVSLALPAVAWNGTGHRVIAAIAYARLTPQARERVDALIRQHPDYATLFTKDAPPDPAARALHAFEFAATWPDVIRGDMRFYDSTRENATPTLLLPGFPSMDRHVTWHYYDIPFAPDGAAIKEQAPPHALSELRRILDEIGNKRVAVPLQVYDLPWLLHIEGDVHQPLHATTRFLKSQPKGDAGGNFVYIAPNTNLHAVWDNLPGTDISDAYIASYASAVAADFPAPHQLSSNPRRWLEESFALVKSDVYTFGLETGSKELPLTLPADYKQKAQKIARVRIALAGYRLAAILNTRFR